jgi:steroid 5-alpha reductase family enzyme
MENKKGFKKYIFTGYIILFAILAISRIDVLELKNLAHLTQTCYIFGITGIAVTLIALPVSVMKKNLSEKVRLLIQFCCAAINIVIYILTLETSSLLCALIALCISISQKADTTPENEETNE